MTDVGQDPRARPDALRSVDSATFAGAYVVIGGPLTRPVRLIKFVNNSNQLVTISWDGVHDHDILPAGSFTLYDLTSNEVKDDGWYVAVGTQFYVKGAAGTGLVYLVCID